MSSWPLCCDNQYMNEAFGKSTMRSFPSEIRVSFCYKRNLWIQYKPSPVIWSILLSSTMKGGRRELVELHLLLPSRRKTNFGIPLPIPEGQSEVLRGIIIQCHPRQGYLHIHIVRLGIGLLILSESFYQNYGVNKWGVCVGVDSMGSRFSLLSKRSNVRHSNCLWIGNSILLLLFWRMVIFCRLRYLHWPFWSSSFCTISRAGCSVLLLLWGNAWLIVLHSR